MTPKQRRDAAMLKQQTIVNAAKADGNRALTAAEQAEFESLQREIEQAEAEIEAEERGLAGGTGAAAAPPTVPIQGVPTVTPQTASIEGQRNEAMAERSRVTEILALCRDFDMDPSEHIQNGSSVEQVRSAILDGMRKTGAPVNVQVTRDEEDTFRERATDALLMRAGFTVDTPAEGANALRAMSLRDFGIECLSRDGRNTMELLRMEPDQMYGELCRQFYNPTAAFPAILDNTIKKSIVQLYNKVPTTFQAWTTKGSLKDFKITADHQYAIGGMGDFLLVPENGELKPAIPKTELLPNRKLDTYGRTFSMTRQSFINDDIGFLTEIPGLYAASAKKTIDKQVYRLLYNNGKIFDGINLFDAKHRNLMKTGSKPSLSSLQSMILQMQNQRDQFGEAIYITPQHIIVPVGYQFDLAVIFNSTQVVGSNNNDINPLFEYPLNIIQTPVLNVLAGENAVPWFMVADTISANCIQVDYLNGQETPTVRRMETPGVLGFQWDIYLDWGISVRDFRGIAKNPGEKIPLPVAA
ncbi:MAG: Mu-like prophage major head subunit gpT family protein [Lachnospiraceae bacterium]